MDDQVLFDDEQMDFNFVSAEYKTRGHEYVVGPYKDDKRVRLEPTGKSEIVLPPCTFEGQLPFMIYDPDQPLPGSAPDFEGKFNFGFNQTTYRAYLAKQAQIRVYLQSKNAGQAPEPRAGAPHLPPQGGY